MDKKQSLFSRLEEIDRRPEPFSCYTRLEFWNDPHISKGLLQMHLDPDNDWASRNAAFTEKSVRWIREHFGIGDGSRVIDFGCGPGKYTTPFAEAGAQVTGIDFSSRSIQHAREIADEKGLNIEYVLQDYLQFSTADRFDLITMIWCDFSALSPSQRAVLLTKFRGLLKEGGSILLDVDSMVRFNTARKDGSEYKYHPGADLYSAAPHYVFSSWHGYEKESVLLQKDVIIEEDRELKMYHWAQCFSMESIKQEFAENGLQVRDVFSDVAGSPYSGKSPVIAVVAVAG